MAPNLANLKGLVTCMVPNLTNLQGLVTCMAPNPANLHGSVTLLPGRESGWEVGREEGSPNLEREGGMEGGRRLPFNSIARAFGMAVQGVRSSKRLSG